MAGSKKENLLRRFENHFSFVILSLIVVLLLVEVIGRKFFSTGIPGSSGYIQHLVLWIAFIGAMITTREKKHLSLSIGIENIKEPFKRWIKTATSFISVNVCTTFTLTSIRFVIVGFDPSQKVGFLPIHFFLFFMPIGFFIITLRFIKHTEGGITEKLIISSGAIVAIIFSLHSIFFLIQDISLFINPDDFTTFDKMAGLIEVYNSFYSPVLSILLWPIVIILIASAILGTPIFIVLGGLAIVFFANSGLSIGDIPQEAYTVLSRHEIPAIPLFTLAGFLLSESKAGERFVGFFKSFVGWLPGGLAIVAILVCTFFTTFTGASGVTILALGGLLSIVLIKRKYKESFSYGLLTGSGSVGLLFPPSLPLIMYGVAAAISIRDLFIGGILPGILLVLTLCIMGIYHAVHNKVKRIPFKLKNIISPFKESLPELMLPVIILICFFSGFTTLVETGAIAVFYVLVIEVFLYKDIKIKELPKVFIKGIPIIGGILIILAIAKGLSYYIIDQRIPLHLTNWCENNITSPIIFLILLNIGLLITGCFMDIFSAILVVAPLVIPLGQLYRIHPVHLGIIFLANLQLGYMTPPVGLNLFLASYRFNQPLVKIYKQVLPFFLAMLVSVLLITYVPPITTLFLKPVKNPGDVWLVKKKNNEKNSNFFTTEVHVDSGTQKFAAYDFEIAYDPVLVKLYEKIGMQGVVPGPNGFITSVNSDNPGILIIQGLDIFGKLPGRDLYMADINWKAISEGTVEYIIKVNVLKDESQEDIGKPFGIPLKLKL